MSLQLTGNSVIFDDGSIQITAYTGISIQPEYPVRAYIIGGMISLYNSSTNTYDRGLPIIYSEDVPDFDYVPLKLYGNIEYGNTSILVDCQSNINQALLDFPGTYVYYSSLEVVLVDADNKIVGWATSATSPAPMPTHGSDGYKLTINLFDFPDLSGVPDTWVLTNTSFSVDQYEGRIFTDPVAYKQISSRFIDNLEHNWNNIPNDPIKNIVAGNNVSISNNDGIFTISATGEIVASSGIFDVLSLNTNIEPDLLQGQIAWNDTEGTIDIGLSDTATISIGEHNVFRIRNETGGPLYKGQAVYASNVHSNGIITPALYVADGSVREVRFMGLLLENVNNNNNGYAINFGHIFNIDTRGNVSSNIAVGNETWVDGDILYVHPTVPGKLTKVEPKHSISVAIVLDAANNGKIFVRPISYGHLDDNHDVSVSEATDGQFLQYNATTDYWVPSSSGNFTSLKVNNVDVSIDGHSHAYSSVMNGRLTLSSTSPYESYDPSPAPPTIGQILYYHPYEGNKISLYNTSDSEWQLYDLNSTISLGLSGIVADTNYDIFIFDNSGSLTMELVPWANSGAGTSSRTSLPSIFTRIDGVLVRNGALNKRYIGSLRAKTNGVCDDSSSHRFLWNYYNQREKIISFTETTNHTYNGDIRPWNNNTNYGQTRAGFIVGFTESVPLTVHINTSTRYDGGAGPPQGESVASVGLNSTSSHSCSCLLTSNQSNLRLRYGTSSVLSVLIGFNYLQALESTNSQGDGFFNEFNLRSSILG